MKSKSHVLIPYTTQVACGAPHHAINAAYREQVTCKVCRASPLFKQLPSMPRKYRK